MNKTLTILILVFILSCNSKTEKIIKLENPKMELFNQFEFKPNGKITYQFYHEYGFTDKIWHLISIIKPKTKPNYKYKLPLDSVILSKFNKIDLQKFIPNKPIAFNGDYKTNSDITLRAEQFYLNNSEINIKHQKGSYNIKIIGEVEILQIYDAENKIEYIELKK